MAQVLSVACFPICSVLEWTFGRCRESLREALVDAAVDSGEVKIPEEQEGNWYGEVTVEDGYFIATIKSGSKLQFGEGRTDTSGA